MASSAPQANCPAPSWLTEDYLLEILEQEFEKFTINEVSVAPATGKGENFIAVLYRTSISGEAKDEGATKRSYIIKSRPTEAVTLEIMEGFNVFPKEIEMYEQLIPKFEAMLKTVGDETIFSPKCFKVNRYPTPTDVIVLEDMNAVNYRMANRQTGLDLDHMKILLTKLAKMHAASAVYYETNGPYHKHFDYGMYAPNIKPIMVRMYDMNFTPMQNIIAKWPTNCKQYSDKMSSWREILFDRVFDVVQPNDEATGFNVLNHGDLWTNNMLFKYDSIGNVEDVILIDFQLSQWSSPAVDLNYLIFTSVAPKLKLKEFDFFIQFYHTHLVQALTKLGYKKRIPKLLELQVDVMKRGLFGCVSTLGVLAVAMLDPRDEISIDLMMADNPQAMELKEAMYNNPKYIDIMSELLPYFDKKGYLDLD